MTLIAKCDHCGCREPATRCGVDAWTAPKGWRICLWPDQQRIVILCSGGCLDAVMRAGGVRGLSTILPSQAAGLSQACEPPAPPRNGDVIIPPPATDAAE